jgi:AcrR family transcriptional regulator
MPRALNEQEKGKVLERFHTLSRDRFCRQGLLKTSVADLIEDAEIGKGTFYQFFASKEHHFWAIIQREDQIFRRDLLCELKSLSCGREASFALLLSPRTRLDEHPLLRLLLDPATVSALGERLGFDQLRADNEKDREFFLDLADDWRTRGWLRCDVSSDEVFDCLAALFLVALQRELIGEQESAHAITVIAEALSVRWT